MLLVVALNAVTVVVDLINRLLLNSCQLLYSNAVPDPYLQVEEENVPLILRLGVVVVVCG